jgi:23S rRNA pseudouridine1911/1915/1917 synthase
MPDPTFQFQTDAAQTDERLDRFLCRQLPAVSRSKIKAAIDSGGARVNGAVAKPAHRLKVGDHIDFHVPSAKPADDAAPENLPLDVLYEDDSLAVIEKPAGMVVHVGAGHRSGTLVNALRFHLNSLSRATEMFRPGIVHRLDKLTSGLMVVAKTDAAHAALAEQFHGRTVEKKYIALAHGRLKNRAGEIRLSIARDRIHRTRMTTRRPMGREALTRYRVTREYEKYSLLEVEIKTGRTHQIRVHLSALGHPVVGDRTYGAPQRIWLPGHSTTVPTLDRHFLHAAHLSFVHPVERRRVSFDSPLPQDLTRFLDACEPSALKAAALH